MYVQHPDFEEPANTSTKLWRYMDLSKLLSMLDTSSLYFTRADKFVDPFEGTIPPINSENIKTYFSEFDNAENMRDELLNLFKMNRKITLINCWYQSEYESDAMWQLYSNNGVAIQSTFEKLKKSISISDDEIRIGQVKYIDFDTEGMYFLNALTPFLFKRISFEHEKEVRAVIWNTKPIRESKEKDDKVEIKIIDHGKLSKVDIHTLIESIYVSPTAPDWFYNLIVSILQKYKIDKPVIHSRLYTINDSSKKENEEAQSEIIISKEILEHFYKKDAFRIDIENLKKERERFREYENFINEIKSLEDELVKCKFKSAIGKDALLRFSLSQFSKKEIQELFNQALFKTIYFLTGRIDSLMRDVKGSMVSDKEKGILIRKIIYFYTENLIQPAFNLVIQIQKHQIEDSPFNIFIGFTSYMADLIIKNEV